MSRGALRVFILTEEDPFYLPVFFREFLAGVPRDRVDVLGIDIKPPLNQATRGALARKLYRFYGARDFVLPVDKPVGPTGKRGKCPVCRAEFQVLQGIIPPHTALGKSQPCLGAGGPPHEPKAKIDNRGRQGSLF